MTAQHAHSSPVVSDDRHGVITLRVDDRLDQVLRRVVVGIEALALDVLAVIDHSGDAADAGVTMPETKLVLVGSPGPVIDLMVDHPPIAIELPLKLLIREGDDGQVFVSYHAPQSVARRWALTEHEANALRVVEAIARQARQNSGR